MTSKLPPLFKASDAPAKASASAQNPSAPASKTPAGGAAASSSTPAMTGEGLMQRLRYFENLASQYESYINVLKAAITRQGGAVPVGYFAPLTGKGGDYSPKG